MRVDISAKGYASGYPALMGNVVFNNTVHFKSAFFKNLMTPFIEELDSNDRRLRSKYMVLTMKLQINRLKIVMNKEHLKLVNIMLYKEVISKYISSSVFQFVLVALAKAGMVFIRKKYVGDDYCEKGVH